MANYTSQTSDKEKAVARKKLLTGGIGLHLFYVGRIKAGIIRLALGIICWILLIFGIFNLEPAGIAGGAIFLILINIPDFIRLKLGTFRDNVGSCLRN